MSETGFYHLERQSIEDALPKLVARILDAKMKIVVRCANAEARDKLDEALWRYDEASFLPHGTEKDKYPDQQPVYLTTQGDNPAGAEVLIAVGEANLDGRVDYARCCFMFDGRSHAMTEEARARWRAMKDAGESLKYWQQDDAGRWIDKA